MLEWRCPKCNSTNVRFMVHVLIAAPMSMWGNFTKANLRKKEVALWGTDWTHADVYCMDCSTLLRSSIHGQEIIDNETQT